MDDKKILPKKLEDDLNKNASKYKPKNPLIPQIYSAPPSLNDEVLNYMKKDRIESDFSAEKALFDEVFGTKKPQTAKSLLPLENQFINKPNNVLNLNNIFNHTKNDSNNIDNNNKISNNNSNNSTTNINNDFNVSLIKRLNEAEETEKILRRQLAEVIMKNETLSRENRELKATLNASNENELIEEIADLRYENNQYQNQIEEMENFLRDYGLEWVGNNQDEVHKKEKESEDIINIDRLVKAIEELNNVVKSEPSQIKKEVDTRRAKIVSTEELLEKVPLIIYKNGLLVKRGPFRTKNSESYLSFCQDVIDGYFPSEFKNDYPDGVIFNLIDKRNSDYKEDDADNVVSKMSSSQFINRLPATIVKNGEIINIRKDVASKLGFEESKDNKPSSNNLTKGSKSLIQLETPASISEDSNDRYDKSIIGITTIQLKWIDGNQVLIKMYETDLIYQLKEYIVRYFGGLDCPDFELRGGYPPRKLTDSTTFIEAGLTPNGTIHAKKI